MYVTLDTLPSIEDQGQTDRAPILAKHMTLGGEL